MMQAFLLQHFVPYCAKLGTCDALQHLQTESAFDSSDAPCVIQELRMTQVQHKRLLASKHGWQHL